MTVKISLHPTRPDRIKVSAAYRFKDLIKSCPGARWSKDDGYWSVPLAWTACLAMRGIFGPELEVADDLSKWAWERKTTVIEPAMLLREAMDAPGDDRLYSFQRAGVAWLKLVQRGLLLDEMGSGKTVQTAVALRELHQEGRLHGPVLIVSPNTMKGTWKRELSVWWPEVQAHIIGGTAVKRTKQFAAVQKDLDEHKPVAVIINWEGLRSHSRLVHFGSTALKTCAECGGDENIKVAQCEKHPRELNAIRFGAVIADEAHRALDPHSKQTRALRAASGEYGNIRFGLTGTPISKDPTQLWTLLNWADEREWPTKQAWVDRMVDFVHNVFGGIEINGLNPLTEAEFHATVDPKTRRMLKKVVLPFLPPIINERRDVEMSPKQAKQYNDMRDLLIARLDSGTLVASNAMVQVGRLVQLASSCGDIKVRQVPDVRTFDDPIVEWNGAEWEYKVDYTTGEIITQKVRRQATDAAGNGLLKDEEYMEVIDPSAKLDAFMADLPDFEGQSVAVFAESRQLIELLSERMAKRGISHGMITGEVTEGQRNATIEAFQRGDFKYVLCTIKAGGTGITLTEASVGVYLQRNWSPVEMSQAYARVHRIGSEKHESILIVDYVTKDTIEEDQIGVLDTKRELIEEIVRDEEQLRKLLTGVWEPVEEVAA